MNLVCDFFNGVPHVVGGIPHMVGSIPHVVGAVSHVVIHEVPKAIWDAANFMAREVPAVIQFLCTDHSRGLQNDVRALRASVRAMQELSRIDEEQLNQMREIFARVNAMRQRQPVLADGLAEGLVHS